MNPIKARIFSLSILVFAVLAVLPTLSSAHHSFAVYDFETQIPFQGTVDTLKFKNPHIQMTLRSVDENGVEKIINFVEGAPANMAVRQGLKPEMIAVGTKITVVGSPRKDDDTQFFIRQIILENGDNWKW